MYTIGKHFAPEFKDLINNTSLQLLKLNGIAELDPFILADSYQAISNVAEVSVDPNANINSKSPVNFQSEIFKPIMKMRSLNILWNEIRDSESKEKADECISACLTGKLYFHDLVKLDMPYSYHQDTTILVKINEEVKLMSMRNLFEMFSDSAEEVPGMLKVDFNKPLVIAKNCDLKTGSTTKKEKIYRTIGTAKKNFEVFNGKCFMKLDSVLKHPRHSSLFAIETGDGRLTVVTSEHPVVLETGAIDAKDVKVGDRLLQPVGKYPKLTQQIDIDKNLAYLIGFIIGDGFLNKDMNHISIKQRNKDYIVNIIESLKLTYKVYNDAININDADFTRFIAAFFDTGRTTYDKKLPSDIYNWNDESAIALLCGIIDAEGTVSGKGMLVRVSNQGVLQQMREVLDTLEMDFLSLRVGLSYRTGYTSTTPVLYKLQFTPSKENEVLFRKYSEKMREVSLDRDSSMVNIGGCEVSKIIEIPLTDNHETYDYVYDITMGTPSKLFSAGGLLQHNCFATDTSHWMLEGRPYGWLPGGQPHKIQSFIGQTVEVAMDLSQEHAGAIGLSNVLVNAAYYTYYDRIQIRRSVNHLDRLVPMETPNRTEEVLNIIVGFFAHRDENFFKKKEEIYQNVKESPTFFTDAAMFLYDKIVDDLLQHLVHVMHNTFRVGGDAPFTNLSLFCRETIKSVFSEAIYPDWTTPLDLIDEIMHIQILYAKFFAKGSPITEKNYRFPVTTVNLATKSREVPLGEEFDPEKHFTEEEKQMYPDNQYLIKDVDFFKTITSFNAKRGVFNFHRGDKIANCCFHASTKVIVKNAKGINVVPIGSIGKKGKEDYLVYHEGEFVKGKFITVDHNDFIKVTLVNGLELFMTHNHINITDIGEVTAQNLTTAHYLPVSLATLPGHGGSYDMGLIVGAFLGDGSFKGDREQIIYSLNSTTKLDLLNTLQTAMHRDFGSHTFVSPYGENGLSLNVTDPVIVALIRRFVCGDTALSKYISPNVLEMSEDFRKGVINGYYSTDGGNNNRIYTSSLPMRDSLVTLCSSIGYATNIKIVDGREGRLGDNPNYCIRIYAPGKRTRLKDVYKIIDGRMYFRVEEIKCVNTRSKGYCFVIDTEEEEFTLANGVITHNCRLVQSLVDLRNKFRSDTFGNGGMSLGSHRVVALNLHGIACEAMMNVTPFDVVLDKYQQLAEILLKTHKKWLKKVIATGMLKFFNIGWENLNMYFSTFGFTGLWDAHRVIASDFYAYEDFARDTISFMESYAQDATNNNPDFAFNVEEIPAENASPKLAQMDNHMYKDMPWYTEVPLLSNQLIPLYEDYDIFDRIEIMGKLMDDVSGGTIAHFNVDGSMTVESSYKLTKALIEVYGLVHFAVEIGTTTCVNGHTSVGIHPKCPKCQGEIQTWTCRIVGYNSDTCDWIAIRKNWEQPRRRRYNID